MVNILPHTNRPTGTLLTQEVYNGDHLVHITNATNLAALINALEGLGSLPDKQTASLRTLDASVTKIVTQSYDGVNYPGIGGAPYVETSSGTYASYPDEARFTTNSGTRYWVLAPMYMLQAAMVGCFPTAPQAPLAVDDQFDAAVEVCPLIGAYEIHFMSGLHYLYENHELPRFISYHGAGSPPNFRPGIGGADFINLQAASYITTFVACGAEGPRDQTQDYVTECRQLGYGRVNAVRLYTNAVDAEFRLTDFTNRDASGATPATLREFSSLFTVEENFERFNMHRIRIIPSCPDEALGEIEGLSGYALSSVIKGWSDWDFGIFISNPWMMHMEECQIVGYWKLGSMFNWGPYKQLGAFTGTPNAEHQQFVRCQFMPQPVLRSADMWATVDKDSNDIYIRATESHTFPTSAGSIRMSASVDAASGSFYDYSGVVHSATTPNAVADTLGFGFLRFQNVRPTGAGANDTSALNTVFANGDNNSKLVPFFSGGHSHTYFDNCDFTDFAHCTGLDEAHPDFFADPTDTGNGYGLPGREQYSCALELSGGPMRAVKLNNCRLTVSGPVCIKAGAAVDFFMQGDTYAEVRPYKATSVSGSLDGIRGALFIAGPAAALVNDAGNAGRFSGMSFGSGLNDVISMFPWMNARAGSRMVTQTDVFNPRYFVDISNLIVQNSSSEVQYSTPQGQQVRHGRRDVTTGITKNYLYARTSGGVDLLDMMDGTVRIAEDDYFAPVANDTVDLGRASQRFDLGYINSLRLGTSSRIWTTQAGTPIGSLSASIGSLAGQTDGTAGNVLFVKESGTGNTGWAEVRDVTETSTTANLSAIGNAINTTNKRTGKILANTTDNKLYRAQGATAGALWISVDGATTITPV